MAEYRAQNIFGRWWIVLGTERVVEVPNKRLARAMAAELSRRETTTGSDETEKS